jgi:hypothetical protein
MRIGASIVRGWPMQIDLFMQNWLADAHWRADWRGWPM